MAALKLERKQVDKPWGREQLWPGFDNPSGEKVGEIWFQAPEGTDEPLLIKYLFTSDRLSIQVHPDDAAAQAAGYKRGKDEAWVVLAAEPDATIALGTTRVATRDELRADALDGSIEQLVDWKPVKAGEFYYSAAGTIHAIGAGLTIIEIQQNVDLTYRLYDYGSDRELHLAAGVAVSDPVPFVVPRIPGDAGNGRFILCEGGKFVAERWSWGGERRVDLGTTPGWLIQVAGSSVVDGQGVAAGDCYLLESAATVTPGDGSDIVFAYPLAERANLFSGA
ncbi:Phosphoheptose isomerase [Sphingomonas antarctica]|uniref:class I mannose-6-phosphate isomerase n=1 Tax=Sphingomonas antarctica TaxID=2040274 RepID=UPI0039ECE7F2